MTGRARSLIILGLAVALVITLLVWRTNREGEFTSPASPAQPATRPAPLGSSPLAPATVTPLRSPLPLPPTASPVINTATLEAIRAVRPTATPPSASGLRLPYISPATWRGWALRILAVAGLLAYIGLRLRQSQKT